MRRPWGHLAAWIQAPDNANLSVVCSASFEQRCLGVVDIGRVKGFSHAAIIKIAPPARSRFRSELVHKIDHNYSVLAESFSGADVFDGGLLDPPAEYFRFLQGISAKWSDTLFVDMTCIPKRFLCHAIAEALNNPNVRNFYLGYSIPCAYTEESLSEDQLPIRPFPAFSKEELLHREPECVVAGVGYMSFDLDGLLQSMNTRPSTSIMFPFPPGAPGFQRNWQSLLTLMGEGNGFIEPIRVDARDLSYAFDVLDDITCEGTYGAYLLPYGPKPHAAAMMFHSIKRKSELLYTQPTTYNPNYSVGLRRVAGLPEMYVYAIRLDGCDLYA